MGEDREQMWQAWNPLPGDFIWVNATARGRVAKYWSFGNDTVDDLAELALAGAWTIEALTGQPRVARGFRRPWRVKGGT